MVRHAMRGLSHERVTMALLLRRRKERATALRAVRVGATHAIQGSSQRLQLRPEDAGRARKDDQRQAREKHSQ